MRHLKYPPDLLFIHAFFKADLPYGARTTIQINSFEEGAEWMNLLDRGITGYDEIQVTPQEVLADLWSKSPLEDKDLKIRMVVMCSIIWLELRGHLKPDTFNGIKFIWGIRP